MSLDTSRPLFRVILAQPEIPNNTGNIGRTCIATGCSLDLIRPLGFDTSEKACRRAGLDYWPRLNVQEHESLDAFLGPLNASRVWIFSTKVTTPYFDADFRRGDCLLFGRETAGLPPDILDRFAATALRMPMIAGERSLNLATAVCAVVFEGIRRLALRREIDIRAGNICEPA